MPGSIFPTLEDAIAATKVRAAQYNTLVDALEALKVWTTKGDLIYGYDADQLERLAIVLGGMLYADPSTGVPKWLAKPSVISFLKNDSGGVPAWVALTMANVGKKLCQAYSSVDVSIPSGYVSTPITLDSEESGFDADGWHSISTNTDRITPNVAGYYRAFFDANWNTSAASQVEIWKNGTSGTRIAVNASGFLINMFSRLVFLNGTTDYVNTIAFQNTGTRYIQSPYFSLVSEGI